MMHAASILYMFHSPYPAFHILQLNGKGSRKKGYRKEVALIDISFI